MANKIVICYLRANSALLEDHFLNRLAQYFAPRAEHEDTQVPPVVHVELFFPGNNQNDTGLSAGIHYGGTTFLYPKTFSRKHWVFHSIPATARQVSLAKEFCRRQQGSSFNYRGFFAPSFLNISHATRLKGLESKRMPWYCSELATYALLHAGLIDDKEAIAAKVHPNAVYNVVQHCCNTFLDTARTITAKPLQL